MASNTSNHSARDNVHAEVRQEADGLVRVVLSGCLEVHNAGFLWRELEARLSPLRTPRIEVDASRLEFQGGIGIALLEYLGEGKLTPGASVHISGLAQSAQKLFRAFAAENLPPARPGSPNAGLVEELGRATRKILRDLLEQISFVGSVVRALPGALARPKQMRWREVRHVMETAGADSLPLVGTVCWLMGLVMALESVRPLQRFGAQSMVGDLIGFASLRDIGPIVTGIMLASRSSSAFAAELATMKVTQELDALKTMGLEPIRFLVVQRVVASLFLTPLLALYGMLLAVVGGVMVMRIVSFPPRMIFHQILDGVGLNDLGVGLTKSVMFGLIIGGVGCLRGLQSQEGPQAVGVSTTRSVVTSVMLIIIANTIYSTANYILDSIP